jgi:hypothetical protein
MSNPTPDGGRRGLTDICNAVPKNRVHADALTCENDQAKLDLFSRLACSTNLSKIRKRRPPERALGIEARAVTPGCPRTCCAAVITFASNKQRFDANFLRLSKSRYPVKHLFSCCFQVFLGSDLAGRTGPIWTHGARPQRLTSRKISKIGRQ